MTSLCLKVDNEWKRIEEEFVLDFHHIFYGLIDRHMSDKIVIYD